MKTLKSESMHKKLVIEKAKATVLMERGSKKNVIGANRATQVPNFHNPILDTASGDMRRQKTQTMLAVEFMNP